MDSRSTVTDVGNRVRNRPFCVQSIGWGGRGTVNDVGNRVRSKSFCVQSIMVEMDGEGEGIGR